MNSVEEYLADVVDGHLVYGLDFDGVYDGFVGTRVKPTLVLEADGTPPSQFDTGQKLHGIEILGATLLDKERRLNTTFIIHHPGMSAEVDWIKIFSSEELADRQLGFAEDSNASEPDDPEECTVMSLQQVLDLLATETDSDSSDEK